MSKAAKADGIGGRGEGIAEIGTLRHAGILDLRAQCIAYIAIALPLDILAGVITVTLVGPSRLARGVREPVTNTSLCVSSGTAGQHAIVERCSFQITALECLRQGLLGGVAALDGRALIGPHQIRIERQQLTALAADVRQ